MQSPRHRSTSLGAERGAWGESVATEYLRRGGFEIIDRNSRPVERDGRLEIDIVAWERRSDTMVFVEVKQHARVETCARRLRSVDRRAFRFDVIEVYGEPGGGRPIVDHITDVALFSAPDRFVNWN